MRNPQTSNAVLLVRPRSFGFHPEAAESNAFARGGSGDVAKAALAEFDALATALNAAGVEVLVLDDNGAEEKPDAVFPNNWVSFHADGTIVLYPMATEARRRERDVEGLKRVLLSAGFECRATIDLSFHERNGHFLEGTGSLILDRPNRRAYANVSPRTDSVVIADFDDRLDYSTLVFDAHDRSGKAIYHTNVLLSLGTRFAALCTDCVAPEYRPVLIGEFEANGREVIAVDYAQMAQFACNIIELKGRDGAPVVALSATALASLRPEQRKKLEAHASLVPAAIPTIEQVGGGSVRCMIADVHLPRA